MAFSQKLRSAIRNALVCPASAQEFESFLEGLGVPVAPEGGEPKPKPELTINTIEATSGTLPTAGGSTVFADPANPTVSELLDLCIEQQAQIEALIAALTC